MSTKFNKHTCLGLDKLINDKLTEFKVPAPFSSWESFKKFMPAGSYVYGEFLLKAVSDIDFKMPEDNLERALVEYELKFSVPGTDMSECMEKILKDNNWEKYYTHLNSVVTYRYGGVNGTFSVCIHVRKDGDKIIPDEVFSLETIHYSPDLEYGWGIMGQNIDNFYEKLIGVYIPPDLANMVVIRKIIKNKYTYGKLGFRFFVTCPENQICKIISQYNIWNNEFERAHLWLDLLKHPIPGWLKYFADHNRDACSDYDPDTFEFKMRFMNKGCDEALKKLPKGYLKEIYTEAQIKDLFETDWIKAEKDYFSKCTKQPGSSATWGSNNMGDAVTPTTTTTSLPVDTKIDPFSAKVMAERSEKALMAYLENILKHIQEASDNGEKQFQPDESLLKNVLKVKKLLTDKGYNVAEEGGVITW